MRVTGALSPPVQAAPVARPAGTTRCGSASAFTTPPTSTTMLVSQPQRTPARTRPSICPAAWTTAVVPASEPGAAGPASRT
ncbi:Uncharacterised protein [Mycobacteroides abscessus]|nr:Uncharacterised protein [Mycobacteroides abscessus]